MKYAENKGRLRWVEGSSSWLCIAGGAYWYSIRILKAQTQMIDICIHSLLIALKQNAMFDGLSMFSSIMNS